jgi:hypothetical protein
MVAAMGIPRECPSRDAFSSMENPWNRAPCKFFPKVSDRLMAQLVREGSSGLLPFRKLNSMDACWENIRSKKYIKPSTSGLEIEVNGPRDDVVINLTWAGEGHSKPYIENLK